MRLREALYSSSMSDIINSIDERPTMTRKEKEKKRARNFVDRSLQGAALSGHPNVPVGEESFAGGTQKSFGRTNNSLDSTKQVEVILSSQEAPPKAQTSTDKAPEAQEQKKMVITLKGLNRKGTTAIYTGTLGTVRIGLAAFPGKTAPETIEVVGDIFAVRQPKAPKVKLTKEERAALPKPTEAERIAKMEERLNAAKAKLAAQAAAAQPEL
jgi:hypothetical protein